MITAALRVAWYRFRATFRASWRPHLALVVLIGLIGGVALGSLAAGRRTASSFAVYLNATNPSDLSVETILDSGNGGYSATLTNEIAHLPHVRRVAAGTLGLDLFSVGSNDLPSVTNAEENAFDRTEVTSIGSINGLYFDQDRVTVVKGKMADPSRADEAVLTPEAAQLLHWHVGERFRIGLYTPSQLRSETSLSSVKFKPRRVVEVTLVGLVVFNSAVVQDDINRFPTYVLLTPALTREVIATEGAGVSLYGLQLDDPSRYLSKVEQEINAIVPPSLLEFHVTSLVSSDAERTIEPEAVALGVFGGIAALAALFIAAQAIGRLLRVRDDDLAVLRAVGADPMTTTLDGLIGILGAVVLGAIVAVGVAVALSPFAPIGPVRAIYPSRGVAADWTVLGIGFAVLVGGLGAITVVLAFRGTPHRIAALQRVERLSGTTRFLAATHLPAPAVTGLHFAVEPGRGRSSVPVRTVLLATVLAVVMVVATLTFGDGLSTLASTPRLYGWNWSYAIQASAGYGDVPLTEVQGLLAENHLVVGAAELAFVSIELDGQTVPVMFGRPDATVAPEILSGHGLQAENQIVLGSATLAALHKQVGDTIYASYGTPKDKPSYIPRTAIRIVGTATMPAIGTPQGLHASMGTGALASFSLFGHGVAQSCQGPSSVVVVRLRTGVPAAAGLAAMQKTTAAVASKFANLPSSNDCAGESIALLGVQHPAEIVNYRSMGGTPGVLAAGVAVGAVAALGLTLAASVRRRRRDLALLKTLGFTQWQLATTVAWQASFVAFVGVVAGIPLGVALGRWLWILFAREIYAVPDPAVPLWSIVLVGLGTLLFANIVAAVPGRMAAHTSTASVLRTE